MSGHGVMTSFSRSCLAPGTGFVTFRVHSASCSLQITQITSESSQPCRWIRDVKFEPTEPPSLRRAFAGPNVRLLGSRWAQHEWPNAKGIYCQAQCRTQR